MSRSGSWHCSRSRSEAIGHQHGGIEDIRDSWAYLICLLGLQLLKQLLRLLLCRESAHCKGVVGCGAQQAYTVNRGRYVAIDGESGALSLVG